MSEPSPQLTLSIGDRVVYPNQGVCRVSGVEAKEVAGQRLTFVTMKREEDGAVVMVPQAKVQSIGLRKVATSDEVGRIFAFLKSDSDKANLDWKQRARTNLDRMAQGGILGLAEVVKGLQVLSELRPLPNKERELYDNARHLLVTEISVSLGIPEADSEDAIDIVLFPVGRERPKRTTEEFKVVANDDDEGLELGDDLISLGGDLDLPPDEQETTRDTETPESTPSRKANFSDEDETQPMGAALIPDEELPVKRKRGRPPKPALQPKKRGLPPKKRGRPIKVAKALPPKKAAKKKKKKK